MMKQPFLFGSITLWLLSFSFMVQAQVQNYSLESSSDGISWQVFPQASTPMTGQQLSSQQVSLPEHVRGVVQAPCLQPMLRRVMKHVPNMPIIYIR